MLVLNLDSFSFEEDSCKGENCMGVFRYINKITLFAAFFLSMSYQGYASDFIRVTAPVLSVETAQIWGSQPIIYIFIGPTISGTTPSSSGGLMGGESIPYLTINFAYTTDSDMRKSMLSAVLTAMSSGFPVQFRYDDTPGYENRVISLRALSQ